MSNVGKLGVVTRAGYDKDPFSLIHHHALSGSRQQQIAKILSMEGHKPATP